MQQYQNIKRMDLDAILRSAGQIELILNLGGLTGFGPKKPKGKAKVIGAD